jgi:hypothetical protein
MALNWLEFRCRSGHAVHLPVVWAKHRHALKCLDCRRPLKPVVRPRRARKGLKHAS